MTTWEGRFVILHVQYLQSVVVIDIYVQGRVYWVKDTLFFASENYNTLLLPPSSGYNLIDNNLQR